ncbi:ATP-binding cassette domain-containing protein [Rhodobacterales bacterium HKCCE2091]|nr:ATP-binding cassette domain-containing protein [Rhodobacterales bacterium HKCCE2091]
MRDRTPRVIPFPASPAPAADARILFRDLALTRDGTRVIDGLTMALCPTGISAVMGPNGAGKSVLLRIAAGLVAPDAGRVILPLPMRGRVGIVFQSPVLLRRTLRGNLTHALKLARVPRADRARRLDELIALGSLLPLAERPARRLSGGEAQRLAIVRALAANPALLLLDEPTAHLDPASTQGVEALVQRIARAGTKVVIVSHDPGQIARLAVEVAFLHHGRACEVTPMPGFLSAPASAEARAYLKGTILL